MVTVGKYSATELYTQIQIFAIFQSKCNDNKTCQDIGTTTKSMFLRKLINLSEPQISDMKIEDNNVYW